MKDGEHFLAVVTREKTSLDFNFTPNALLPTRTIIHVKV